MLKPFKTQGIVKNAIFLGTLLSTTLHTHAAENVTNTVQPVTGKKPDAGHREKETGRPFCAGSGAEQ